ncbi:P-loop containing nucleoside triphosphate hydrolase protein [Guyanagaster necrorhizus]|uniref:P-loop containing nucleoside triphosphate hydrolase protein n=1 Tax=Guyanagaster necrorhizus TaxID=856835 RepID=A0A9P7VJQ8_9AGAR|nr:P-loop containing nucleoside triphosphate hydrolase protein [Guyanagaster necrorhizus MCA 3950]KAG7441585.1 P-loop containing nucleoside triphosphate hydrolase protein [Guyanagaster necrorhizus MCA 3950]
MKTETPETRTVELGVWKVVLLNDVHRDYRKNWNNILLALPLFRRLAIDIYTLEPMLSILFVLEKFWSGIESAVLLYLSSRLLRIIEVGLVSGTVNSGAILSAVAIRLCCSALAALLSWASDGIHPILRTRVMTHFQLHLMQGKSLPESSTTEAKSKFDVSARHAWTAFEDVADFLQQIVTTGSELALIVQSCRAAESPLFAVLFSGRSLWDQAHVVYTDNKYFQRMKSLVQMATDGYRSEVLGCDLVGYIITEYQKAMSSLGTTSDDWAEQQYSRRTDPLMRISEAIMGDVPMVYYAVAAIMKPSKFSISSIAILHQSSGSLEWSMRCLFRNVSKFRKRCERLRMIYEADKINNKLIDGCLSYPPEKSQGMSFELRDLSFSYPGSQSTKPALSNINLSIKAGQLVVIVGANGSGKSTVIKLLARLYDPTSGPDSLTADGLPISKYRMSELREATAMLTQEHSLFPVPLGENIGLGFVKHVEDMEMIDRAAELGGATHCLAKLTEGKDTILSAMNEAYGHDVPESEAHPLQVEMEKLRKNITLSGGEKQRIVASRTFMRFESGKVKFVVVDEPSSALDPEGEASLFNNLIDAREGKTMIFVTHRFGHLAKRADLIVCMKDGSIVETGNHKELVEMNGEYAKLYNIQASAFV